jgi:thiol-disulfide isomerase/thioredoxin
MISKFNLMINKIPKTFAFLAAFAVVSVFLQTNLFAQKTVDKTVKIPEIIQIDEIKIKEVLKPKGKPLLVNFWATWCVPCREEFPELVEIDHEYKGKIDLITISLDDLAEIKRDVPKFLTEMKATMPAYLLRTTDENAVIGSISKDWEGGLPFTVIYNEKGEIIHTRQGKIKPPIVKAKLDSTLKKEEQ